MNKNLTIISTTLQESLSQHRFTHSVGVAYTAYFLAVCHGYDPEKAYLTGLLHDCAKVIPHDEQLAECQRLGIELTEYEVRNPGALAHAKLGAYMAMYDFGINDTEILEAIACHTVTRPEMSMLDKIIYIADCTEPNREEHLGSEPELLEIRKLATTDLDKAVYYVTKRIIDYLKSTGGEIDPVTIDTYNKYKKQFND